MTLLRVEELSVVFDTVAGPVHAVRNLSFSLEAGQALGIVGESGSGKTVASLSIMRLLSSNARITGGRIVFDGKDILQGDAAAMRKLRGRRISMIFQDPMSALDPVERISKQIGQAMEFHNPSATRADVRRAVISLLEEVGVPDASRRVDQYPHQWSGGMRQRAVIAMALMNSPDLIIADEPTTALDATVQAQVLDALGRAADERGSSVIMVSHDLALVEEMVDEVMVMYAGEAVEHCAAAEIFNNPRHPYTRALLRARPDWRSRRSERLYTIAGTPPDLLAIPSACPFEPRCDLADPSWGCTTEVPKLMLVGERHSAACHKSERLAPLDTRDGSTNTGKKGREAR